ncbi:MAG: hypothetical protein R6V29_01490 [Spirochaetia bacterium]
MRRRTGILVLHVSALILFGAAVTALYPQETPPEAEEAGERSVDWYTERALEAVDSENDTRAVELLKEGQERHPQAVRLYATLGDLYFDEELYRLALAEYQQAERIDPNNFNVIHSAGLSLGRLNRDNEAVRYLERVVELYPDSLEAYADLGWMYFKTHQLEAGEELMLEAIEEFGEERTLTMTLGTIYADMYEYENAKRYYELSIESALADGRNYFASVAYYNLSLLQKAFHRFNDAMQSTEESLAQTERATGHLAKGELYEMQMNFRRAHEQYNRAYNLDEDTPLAKLDLAALYQTFGRLEEALAYARDVYESEDLHWMFNFGIDERRHHMELHGLLADIYRGTAHEVSMTPARSPFEWVSHTVQRIKHRVLAWYHDMTFNRYAAAAAEAYEEQGSQLNAQWTYFRAHEQYPRVAKRYLERARELETELIPDTEPLYAMHRAVLNEDPDAIAAAADSLHPRWERLDIAKGLREIARIARAQGDQSTAGRAAVELYRMNRGAIRQHGIELPVRVSVRGDQQDVARSVRGRLSGAGFRIVEDDALARGVVPPHLELEARADGRVSFRLTDEGRTVAGDTVEAPASDRRRAVAGAVARAVADAVFRVE